jgi:hypothetical protein
MKPTTLIGVPCFVLAILATTFSSSSASASGPAQDFEKIFPLAGVPGYSQEEMITNCGGNYDDARARLFLHQRQGMTWVLIRVDNAAPNTFWTVWLKLDKPSPITGAGAAPLANPSDIPALQAATPPNPGSTDLVNGFWTNHFGRGWFYIKLDYPVIKGAFQFQENDASHARVAIGDTDFTLRIASHCFDGVGHGLLPGKHEMWFDWEY